jgi:hypothetical protein
LRNLTWKKITVPISKFPKATKEIFALPKTMEPIEIHILPGKEILEFKRWCKNKLDPDLREHRPTGSINASQQQYRCQVNYPLF